MAERHPPMTWQIARAILTKFAALHRKTSMLDRLQKIQFETTLGDRYSMTLAKETIDVTLTEVNGLAQADTRNQQREPFSLVFRAPAGHSFEQGIFALEHKLLGRLDLFMVPIGADHSGTYMEAVFN